MQAALSAEDAARKVGRELSMAFQKHELRLGPASEPEAAERGGAAEISFSSEEESEEVPEDDADVDDP